MSTIVQIPMNEETRIALEDVFVDEANMDARKFVFDAIKNACQDAKRCARNKITPVNQRDDNGTPKQEEYKLKDVNLEDYTQNDNPKWLPKNLDEEDNKPIELKLGDNTMKYLKIFGQLVTIRHEQYNMAEEKYMTTQAEEMKMKLNTAQYEQFLKSQETQKTNRLEQVPSCLQEAIFTSVWPTIQQKIDQSDGKMFEEEYKEIYAEVAKEKGKELATKTK